VDRQGIDVVNDKEAIDMMQRCLAEVRSLRAQVEHLSPLADAYIALRDVVRMATPRNGAMAAGQDIIWTLEKRIRELEPKPAPKPDEDDIPF
jgi:predicted RNA-binding Zn ribbon-like protein